MLKTKFIYAWRLTYEKWFDLILNFCDQISLTPLSEKIEIHIFWDWLLKKRIPEYPFLYYYWQQNKDLVLDKWKNCDFSLMPSRFLETFWLSALDSLSVGVPVIWFRKGWLNQFGECVIDWENDVNFYEVVKSWINKNNSLEYGLLSKKCIETYGQYSWLQRKERFELLVWNKVDNNNFLLVSDFSWSIWWIESYIFNVKQQLLLWWGSVSNIFWYSWKNVFFRYLLLPISSFNLFMCYKLIKSLKKEPYNVVWFHSIQRFIWPLPLLFIWRYFTWKKLLTIHDFWIFHPFPSKVYSEDSFLWKMNFSQWLKAGFEVIWPRSLYKVIRFIPLLLKYISSKFLLYGIQKNIDTLIVPSNYMKIYISNYYKWNIVVLPHSI